MPVGAEVFFYKPGFEKDVKSSKKKTIETFQYLRNIILFTFMNSKESSAKFVSALNSPNIVFGFQDNYQRIFNGGLASSLAVDFLPRASSKINLNYFELFEAKVVKAKCNI